MLGEREQFNAMEFSAVASAVGLVLGAVSGYALRTLLGRLRRGVILRVGPTEAAGAVVTAVGAGLAWGRPVLGLVLLAGLLLVALSGVDIVHHRLLDAITLPALPLAVLTVLTTKLLHPDSGSLVRATGCAAALWLIFAGVAWLSPAAMGRGDVKLVPTLVLLMGYVSVGAVVLGLAVSFVLGSVVALVGMAARKLRLNSAIPLGPYLLLGCWSVLLIPAVAR